MNKAHNFHIPVMGIGFTIDTPLKVAHLGISSVISLVDDILLEKLRKMYSAKLNLPYNEITEKTEDYRAKRVTSYLNMINDLAEAKFEAFKNATTDKGNQIKNYLQHLPNSSSIKQEFNALRAKLPSVNQLIDKAKETFEMGSIDVNIMTKVDKTNYKNGKELPVEYNDAHAALRGFAESKLRSSIVLSAGMNPRLYAYMEQFDDFYPTENGYLKKKIILKVSDFKSALIQGKYFAKKGLWVSEYRVESGLNCGGHAFASDGYLLGPILEEFKERREELIFSVNDLYQKALKNKNISLSKSVLPLSVTAQGGVGTSEEHEFLLEKYQLDSVGWGSPFLLVPEATTVDDATLQNLVDAKESDLYLSNISPLGVPFNNLRNNTKEDERLANIAKGKPGSTCPKKFVKLNTELTKKGICTASRTFQLLKIKELNAQDLKPDHHQREYNKIVEKSCICVGLGTSAMIAHDIDTYDIGPGVSVCPGPNMAYYSQTTSLKEMIDHIYGRINILKRKDRPNMFVKELQLYINYLKDKIAENYIAPTSKQTNYLNRFANNLMDGIDYYNTLFDDLKGKFAEAKNDINRELDKGIETINSLKNDINKLKPIPVSNR